MEPVRESYVWQPQHFYQPPPGLPYAVILLNKSLCSSNVSHVRMLWQNASTRVCVDGGTNCYHDLLGRTDQAAPAGPLILPSPDKPHSSSDLPCGNTYLPDIVSGDFDSIRPEVLEYYTGLGVRVVPTPDQDETDMTKAIQVLGHYIQEKKQLVKHVVVIAGNGFQRFDHVMGIIQTLFKVRQVISAPVVVVAGESLLWLLEPGSHTIHIPKAVMEEPEWAWCGLIPVGQPSIVSTSGLKWNLDKQELAFGGIVSTCNTYNPAQHGQVTVSTSLPLLWTMGWGTNHHHTCNGI